jgi:hypothetical protein
MNFPFTLSNPFVASHHIVLAKVGLLAEWIFVFVVLRFVVVVVLSDLSGGAQRIASLLAGIDVVFDGSGEMVVAGVLWFMAAVVDLL